MEKELNECRGCVALIKIEDVDMSDPVAYIYFNAGNWSSVCSFTHIRTRVFRHCPCWECLVRPICRKICEPLHKTIERRGSYVDAIREIKFKQEAK